MRIANDSSFTVGRVVDLADVAGMIGCCKRTVLRMVDAGNFPKPEWYVGKRPRWCESTALQGIENLKRKAGAA